jgi:fibronectin type 3 domain-containing protein
VETILETTANDLVGDFSEDIAGFDDYMGWGRVNANNAVRYVYQAPSNLIATDNQPTVPLTWSAPWRTPSQYDIYRSTTGQTGTYSLLNSTTSTSYDDGAVSSGTTYWYKVKAVFANGQSEYSNADSGTPFINFMPPQNLNAQGGLDGVVPVSWSIPASGTPSQYQLYRSTTGELGTYSLLTTVVPTAYDDHAVTNGNEYWYKAKAVYTSPAGVSDYSNADGAIPLAPVNLPPTISHNPLHDIETGSGVITALCMDPEALPLANVKMFFRIAETVSFDSLTLTATGNPNEFAASLSAFAAGTFEYYLRARDSGGATDYVPATAPSTYYTFDVGVFCGSVLTYDDGSAEAFNYATNDLTEEMLWAVKFTPAQFPFVLCGASFAAARTIPDTVHTPVEVTVMLANGVDGYPGDIIWQGTTGSIGNVIGGFGETTYFADVLIRDAGAVLSIESDFYIALNNIDPLKSEAFGRDTDLPNLHVSYFYDACDEQWYSEDDAVSTNAYPGNRMIRAYGYSLVPPELVISRSSENIRLDWSNTGAASYEVYSSLDSAGPFTVLEGTTTDTTLVDMNAVTDSELKFYQVLSVSH